MNRWCASLSVTALVVVGTAAGCSSGSGKATSTPKPEDANTTSTSAPQPLTPCGGEATVRYAVHTGVDANLNSLDVWRPPATGDAGCSNRPLVVWVHGGGWTGGDKTDDIRDKITLFTGAGYVFASINYRVTNDTVVPPTPQYPVHDQDSADAVHWLVAHAAELGIDLDRIALLGHSAGGGIVAAITTDGAYLGKYGLHLDAIRCAGSIDGEGYDVTVGATHPDPFVHETYLNAFGNDPAVWKAASPMTHIAPNKGIPAYFVAVQGPDVRVDLHNQFANALRAAGVQVTVHDAQPLNHDEVSKNIGAPGDTTMTPAVMDFLTQCFTSEKK